MVSSKLHRNSPAVKLLIKKIRAGKMTEDQTPSDVWESETVFQQFELPTFRSRLYRIRKQLKEEDDDDHEDVHDLGLNRRCTDPDDVPTTRSLMNTCDDDLIEEHSVGNCSEVEEVLSAKNSFSPLYLISEWTEAQTLTKRLSMAILLPSGVDSRDFSVSVAKGGRHLEVVVSWPIALLHVQTLHKKWIHTGVNEERLEVYHPKILRFESALKQKTKQATDTVESTARILLPFKVETHIDRRYNLGRKDGLERIAYVDLRAAVEDYAIKMESNEFELV